VFFIAGLYERHTLLFQKRLPQLLFNSIIINSVIAVLFFYFVPGFLITPKINLFIYLFVSSLLILLWRWYGGVIIGTGRRERVMIIGNGEEFNELVEEVNKNLRYNLEFVSAVDAKDIRDMDIEKEIIKKVKDEKIKMTVVDLQNRELEPVLPHLYPLLFSQMRFISLQVFYEEVFGRVPLSSIGKKWLIENISPLSNTAYDIVKRLMDIVIAIPLLIIPLLAYPFIALAVRLEDNGPVIIRQRRVGRNNSSVEILKFRTMSFDDGGRWRANGKENRITRTGAVLRKTRLDEFPSLWNVLNGDLSLIGPRPEFEEAVEHYTEEVPFYGVRHMIKPGLSGLAQLYGEHPHHDTDVAMTRNKLSYDLFYLKNRSLFLDLKVALKTIKVLLSRSGV
jgi:lipopolysaccharide/colanic/teichoic acid biosynthesis glycosyltransferase